MVVNYANGKEGGVLVPLFGRFLRSPAAAPLSTDSPAVSAELEDGRADARLCESPLATFPSAGGVLAVVKPGELVENDAAIKKLRIPVHVLGHDADASKYVAGLSTI